MKSTGIVRRVDALGRVVIPTELRRVLGIEERDPMEIWHDEQAAAIVLKKYEPGCFFCGSAGNLVEFKGKRVCRGCVEEARG